MRIARGLASLLSALALAFPGGFATADALVPTIAEPAPIRVVVTGDVACPGGRVDDILVCGMRTMGPRQLGFLHALSRCLAHARSSAARAVLADGYDAGDREALRRIAAWSFKCGSGGDVHVSGLLLAGGMAEALLGDLSRRRGLGRLVALDPARPAVEAHDESEMMSLCAVREAPGPTAAFFATAGGSKDEEAAVQALLPQLVDCLGRDIRLVTNRPALRAMLALAALRLALNGRASHGGS